MGTDKTLKEMVAFSRKHWKTFINRRNYTIQWRAHTILTNKAGKGKKGTILAMIAGTKAETVIEKMPLKQPNLVTEITLYIAGNMRLIAKKYFPNATRVTDRFQVQKLATESLQEIRIKYHWQATGFAKLAKW